MNKREFQKNKGAGLIELVLAIGLMAVIVVIIGSTTALIAIDRGTKHLSWATALTREELEVAASRPFTDLTNRTNAAFSWVPYDYGTWVVKALAGAPSSPNVYELKNGSAIANSVSGLALAPFSQVTTLTYTASVYAVSDSPSGWKTGIAFGVVDQNNFYDLRLTGSNLVLEKITAGTPTALYTLTQSFLTNNWNTLKVVTTPSSIEVWLNGLLKNTYGGTVSGGEIGLIGFSGVHSYFDDVSVTASGTTTWNFDADATGNLPASWSRFGLYDFPGASGTLTIGDYNSDPNTKQITVTVTWPEVRGTRSSALTVLKNKY